MNSLGDLYPLLHFLNISPQADWKEFHGHIAKVEKRKPTLAVKRMQVSQAVSKIGDRSTDILGDPENLLHKEEQRLDFEWRPSLESSCQDHQLG